MTRLIAYLNSLPRPTLMESQAVSDEFQPKTLPDVSVAADNREAWVTPRVEKLQAGRAEVGTQNLPDGAFTSS